MDDPHHGNLEPLVLDGGSLTLPDLARVARDPRVAVLCAPAAMERVAACRAVIEEAVDVYRRAYESGSHDAVRDYGITTGFGEFKNIAIPPDRLIELQENLLLSHAVGLGETADAGHPANYFDPEVVRASLAIRLNAFLKGNSGVRPELVSTVRDLLNSGIVPRVPIRGSVGSSGDLCPLSHLFAVLLGATPYYVVREPADLVCRERTYRQGQEALAEDLARPVSAAAPAPQSPPVSRLAHKEGLALNNGATFSAALLALAAHDAAQAAEAADAACALSLSAVCGCARAFDEKVHLARGHAGQIASAKRLRELLAGNRWIERADEVQDPYSLRCAPAVHGAVRDAIDYAAKVAATEINAATDNPLFFPGEAGWDVEFAKNWEKRADGKYKGQDRKSYSAGNFHGEPVGLAADFLGMAVAELANISERRTQMLLDSHHNRNLPANLIPLRGVNSGFMIAQYAAAGVVSENKVLAHPASVDSIPTSANSEDHNAMSTIAARKLRTILRNVQAVLAIELLVAAQAVEWRVGMETPTRRPEGAAPPAKDEAWKRAEEEAERFRERTAAERRPAIAEELGATGRVYLRVRELAEPMWTDRTLDGDVRAVRKALEEGTF
jgi:histidine ammonia-lyase